MSRVVKRIIRPSDENFHNDNGALNLEGIKAYRAAINHPSEHYTVNLGIKAFKRFLRDIPMMTKSMFNQQVSLYKEKSWGEYEELINFKGSFPSVRK